VKPSPRTERLVWTLTLILSAIGVIAVLARLFRLGAPPRATDTGFAEHPLLTAIHILPGLLFVVLAPLQFVKSLRNGRLHRWLGRALVGVGLVIGVSALLMSAQMSIGGLTETTATMSFGALFLFCLVRGFVAIRRCQIAQHREWMLRAFAIGMAVAFIRPIVGIFFATSRLTHLTPHDFFGIAFWLGFVIQTSVAELWIRATRTQVTPLVITQ